MSKWMSYGKIYHSDVRTRPRLPRGCVFTRGRVFTIRSNGKKRVRADASVRVRVPVGAGRHGPAPARPRRRTLDTCRADAVKRLRGRGFRGGRLGFRI
jgi:hypothetical protein